MVSCARFVAGKYAFDCPPSMIAPTYEAFGPAVDDKPTVSSDSHATVVTGIYDSDLAYRLHRKVKAQTIKVEFSAKSPVWRAFKEYLEGLYMAQTMTWWAYAPEMSRENGMLLPFEYDKSLYLTALWPVYPIWYNGGPSYTFWENAVKVNGSGVSAFLGITPTVNHKWGVVKLSASHSLFSSSILTLDYKWYGYGRIIAFDATPIHTKQDMYVVTMTLLIEEAPDGAYPPVPLDIDRYGFVEPNMLANVRVLAAMGDVEFYDPFFTVGATGTNVFIRAAAEVTPGSWLGDLVLEPAEADARVSAAVPSGVQLPGNTGDLMFTSSSVMAEVGTAASSVEIGNDGGFYIVGGLATVIFLASATLDEEGIGDYIVGEIPLGDVLAEITTTFTGSVQYDTGGLLDPGDPVPS